MATRRKLARATRACELTPSAVCHYIPKSPAWASRGNFRRIACSKGEGRLPVWARETRDPFRPNGRATLLPVPIDHFYCLVERLHRHSAQCPVEVQSLPNTARREGAGPVVAIPHRNQAGDGRGWNLHFACLIEPRPMGHLRGNRKQTREQKGHRRKAGGVKRRSVSMNIDLAARITEPTIAIGNHDLVADDRFCRLDDVGVEDLSLRPGFE